MEWGEFKVKHIVGVFGSFIVMMLNTFLCISVINASGAVAEAKEFKSDVVAEIENSNFNSNVINSCIVQAQTEGYKLQITNCIYDEQNSIKTAEVILTYKYEIPFLGIREERTTRGMAR